MKNWKLSLVVIGSLFVSASAWGQTMPGVASKRLDTLLSDAISKDMFSGQVAVCKNGEIVYQRQYGYADWQNKRSIKDNTLYNIGSLTKQFTEEMIRQLVKEGKVDTAANLNEYLDLLPAETGNKITIQQLLYMRSGLGDYFGSPEFHQLEQTDFTLNDILAIIKTEPLLFEPGTAQAYSNSGYAVLGAVIEKVTGKSYEDNLRERIAAPLGLKDIYYTKAEKAAQANRAFGHNISFEGSRITVDDISNSHPDGGVYATLNDMLRFTEAKRTRSLPSGYPYRPEGTYIGGTPTWTAMISFTANGYSYVVLTNQGVSADRIGPRIGLVLRGENYPPVTRPMQVTLYELLKDQGISYIEQHLQELCREDGHPYDDHFLNEYGHKLLFGGKAELAISLFLLNAKLFPQLPNVYYSLGEAYLHTGDKGNARIYYSKVLEIDPHNVQVRDLLQKMSN
jgi:CubicO group peptidase (beta-lactamase class C family)